MFPESLTEACIFLLYSFYVLFISQVRAAGALLTILQREGLCEGKSVFDEFGQNQTAISVGSIGEISLVGMLRLDAVSYSALQIFHEDKHPSAMGCAAVNHPVLTQHHLIN
jgi:hypothetical protein